MSAEHDHQHDHLLKRLLAGEEAAFSELVATHHGTLLRLALTFVSDRAAAEEVVQDTWLGVIKGLRSFERRSSLKTWIFRICVYRARTRGARDSRIVPFSALEPADAEPSALADRFTSEGRWLQPPSRWKEQNPEDLLGMPAFAPLMMPPMRMVAMGSLIGHLIFGLILGALFVWLYRGVHYGAAARA